VVVQHFILKQNRSRFIELLEREKDERFRKIAEGMLREVERDLAFLEASLTGAGGRETPVDDTVAITHFRASTLGSPKLGMALDPGPGLRIIDVNETFVRESLQPRANLIGRPLFDTFPDNPDDPTADGMSALYASLRMAALSGEAQVMPAQRYDVQNTQGVFVTRYWRVVNTPIFDRDHRLAYLLQEVERLEELY
jgi:hypothetical protein